MDNDVGQGARLTRPQVQEQVGDCSGAPPDYKGRITLDPTLLDVVRLEAALETGIFELSNSRVHQNSVLHHIGTSMRCSAVLLHELCRMAGSPYRPADLQEISWQDLQWVKIERQAGRIPVQEEIVEDDAGVISSVVVPTLTSVADEAMGSSEEVSEESVVPVNN